MSEITAKKGKVVVPGSEWDDEYTPAEARELSMQLMRAAHLADAQLAAIAKACKDGHDWDGGFNRTWSTPKTTIYHCEREGCQAQKEEPGWLPFEPKTHKVANWVTMRWETADCTGPGCEHCGNEAMAETFGKMLNEATSSVFRGGITWPEDAAMSDGWKSAHIGAPAIIRPLLGQTEASSTSELTQYLQPLFRQDRFMRDLGYDHMTIELREPSNFTDDTTTLIARWRPAKEQP